MRRTIVADDPQAPIERRAAARHLIQRPLTCREHDPDVFRLIRRHEADLDRWFTQRLGYRLHVDADTARLYKAGVLVEHRPLRTTSGRAFHHREYVLLSLVLATTAAGSPATLARSESARSVSSGEPSRHMGHLVTRFARLGFIPSLIASSIHLR